ncbi:uncharacterized protein si:ch211-14c7.2 isoform X1 [Labrus mixtus]|uniref:uncharacterized protein si:ch211-14c7.2 isoform X1 n=1 Tax=Labrus mixtus TaxID=508554 RepID=UPI0029C0F16B|nr:uncharacterized protein si:ch211-14c7.2 isoform X1 [Labrus mixtus]
MRPTAGTMLQQNNNNNYPCLNVSGSTRDMLQKCSRASLPFHSRMELGLGDLPLIRGLRAWALFSKNRKKAGGLLGGGQAPVAPPAGRGGSTSCPRPADVYLSGEWGGMGYGIPLGLDAGQAGIGALVTVATLKTSEGSGKTQTQCIFLRTEKGSCLYSTAKPGCGMTSSAASSVGGWLRGKTGGGGGGGGSRDTPAGRRDNGPTPPAQTGANRVRVRSGRRWRKSCNAAGREKSGSSREQQRSGGEVPAGEIIQEERQEEGDKGSLDFEQFPSPQQDNNRRACRSPRCSHHDSPETCTRCGRSAQRKGSQDENEGGENPRGVIQNKLDIELEGVRKEKQKNEEEEEEEGSVCGLESSNSSVLDVPNPDPESNHHNPESHSGCDVEEIREAESNEKTSHIKDDCSENKEATDSEEMKVQTRNYDFSHDRSPRATDDISSGHIRDIDHRKPGEIPCEDTAANVNGFPDCVDTDHESEIVNVEEEEEEKGINQTLAELSVVANRSEDASASTCAEPSAPAEGSTCHEDHKSFVVLGEKENSKEDQIEGYQQGVADGPDDSPFELQEANRANTVNEDIKPQFFFKNVEISSKKEEIEASSFSLRHTSPPIFEISVRIGEENRCNYSGTELIGADFRDEAVLEEKEEESREGNKEERVNLQEGEEAEEILSKDCISSVHDSDGKEISVKEAEEDIHVNSIQDKVVRSCALKHECAGGCRVSEAGDTCGQTSIAHVELNGETSTNVTNVPCADPSTSITLSTANPAPSQPPLGSMATGLPCLEAEKEEVEEEEEEEEERVGVTAEDGEGGQEGKRRHGRELEEERVSTVASEEGRKEEAEGEEEDEFGVFMQAEGEPAWSEGSSMSASVPCGSRGSVALGNHAITGESTHWTPGWTDSSFPQSDDTWTAFPQDSSDGGRDADGQWWPTCAVEQSREKLLANQNLASVFAEAFPSLPASSSSDLDTVPTLTQILRGRADQDQGLLDSFHDLNKMICQRYKRANGVSRDLLLTMFHLEQPHAEVKPAPRTANRRLSPGLPSANQHAQNAAAKRRLSYDYNRNIME